VALTGRRQVQKNIDRAIKAALAGLEDEQQGAAEETLSDSRDLAPQLTGLMINTAGTRVDRQKNLITHTVFYSEEYALYQHEGFFNPGPVTALKPNAGRKFLSRALDAKRRLFIERFRRRVEREIRQALS